MVDKNVMDELNKVFEEVESADGIFETLPDGEYLAEIQAAEYKESKSSGKPMIQIAMKVVHGKHEGKWHSRFMMLVGKDDTQLRRNLNAFATQMRQLGIDTSEGFHQTLEKLDELEGQEVVMTIKTVKAKNGNEYTNTSIRPAE